MCSSPDGHPELYLDSQEEQLSGPFADAKPRAIYPFIYQWLVYETPEEGLKAMKKYWYEDKHRIIHPSKQNSHRTILRISVTNTVPHVPIDRRKVCISSAQI